MFPWMMIAQMAMQTANNIKQSRAQGRQYEQDATTYRVNAKRTADELVENETNSRYELAQSLSDYSARMAARGISTSSDLFLNSYLQNVKNAEKNILNERQRGVNEYVDLKNQAALADYNAKKAKRSTLDWALDPLSLYSGWN